MPDVETGENRANGAAGEFHDPGDMGGCIDGNLRSVFRLAGHGAFGKGRLHRGGHAANRPHHGDKRGEIVRAYVEHGARTGLIEEMGVGMPVFHAVVQFECSGSHGRSDRSIVNQLDAGLKTAAEECIGSIADTQLAGVCCLQDGLAVRSCCCERLFSVDGFTRRNGLKRDPGVRVGDGQVDDDLDLWIGQQLVYGACFWNAELPGLATGALQIDVGAGDNLQNVEEAGRFEIDGADIAASDDANGCFSVHILIMAQRAEQPQRVL